MEQANEKKWCVYIHTNKVNNKVYIGITHEHPEDRWGHNGAKYLLKNKDGIYKQPVFANAINKYTWDGFNHIIFAENVSSKEAKRMEVGLIALYKANVCRWGDLACGYNMTDGGDGTCGTKLSEYTRKKHSKTITGDGNSFYGKKHSADTKQLISEIRSIPVVQLDCDGNLVAEYKSAKDAARRSGITAGNIGMCCKKKNKTAGGFVWRYKNEYDKEEQIHVLHTRRNRPVMQFDINGELICEFDNISLAEEATGVNRVSISACCRRKATTAGGFVWKYADDDIIIDFNEIQNSKSTWITVGDRTLNAKQWANELALNKRMINNYILTYGKENTERLVAAMVADPPKNKHRKSKTTWFEVYGINI